MQVLARSALQKVFSLACKPWPVGDDSDTLSWSHQLLLHFTVQCGLDKAHQGADIATQEQVFWQQLQLGKELGRPISVSHPAALC